jgi:hypothetical protein
MYLSLCPQYTIDAKTTKKTKMQPLKFMISCSCGTRAQVDLIDMRSSEDPVMGHKWILCLWKSLVRLQPGLLPEK